jgi:hypothetical protein
MMACWKNQPMLIRKFYFAYPPKGRIFIAALVCAFMALTLTPNRI